MVNALVWGAGVLMLYVQLDPRIGNSYSQSRAKYITEVGFLPYPDMYCPSLPASSSILRLAWSPGGQGRLQQAVSAPGAGQHTL